MSDIAHTVRDVMAETGNDRDRTIALLIERDDDPVVNEAFRVLGIKQAVRSYQTDQRGGLSIVNHDVRSQAAKRAAANPRVQQARQAVRDLVAAFMEMHTLFGGRISLKDATRPDFNRSAESYRGQEEGAKRMRLFHAACAKELPVGSVAATLPVGKWPTVFKLAQEYGVVDAQKAAA